MKSAMARRSDASPNKTSFDKHSRFADRTQSFGIRVQVRTPWRELNRIYAASLERRPK
jgi:hypothetical protein